MNYARLLLWPGLATIMALGILLSLGTWQLQRMAEKRNQIDMLQRSITAQPLALDQLMQSRGAPLDVGSRPLTTPPRNFVEELTRVTLQGEFISGRTIPIRVTLPTTKGSAISGIGFFFMTPLRMTNGSVVFINRGFAASGGDWKAPTIETPEGPQIITGLMRKPELRGTFTPTDNPAKGDYFTRDPKTMAAAVGLQAEAIAPFFVDAERLPDNLTPPVGVDAREMISRIPDNHLQYAVTWFAFALTLLGVFGVFAWGRIKAARGNGDV